MREVCASGIDKTSDARESELNDCLLAADLARGFEEFAMAYLEYYGESVRIKFGNRVFAGRTSGFEVLIELLVRLHIAIEGGGACVNSLRLLGTKVLGPDEYASDWQLDIAGGGWDRGRLEWSSIRSWENGQVIREHAQEKSRRRS
jgi:hypothetical protein